MCDFKSKEWNYKSTGIKLGLHFYRFGKGTYKYDKNQDSVKGNTDALD